MNRDEIINAVKNICDVNFHNSDEEFNKTKNDWVALAAYHLFESSSRPDKHVTFDEFRESLMKSMAIILKAIEISFLHENQSSTEILRELENVKPNTNDGCCCKRYKK